MSETPISPVLDKKSEQIAHNVQERYSTGQIDRDFAQWEYGFDTETQFNLERDDVVNTELWSDTTPTTIEAPAYVEAPKTRAQEVEESYFYLDDKQLLHQALGISKAVPTMRRLV
jgi:hypothetical protein